VRDFPKLSTLLVDTYDTARGVENAAAVASQTRTHGFELQGVRLDSGDLADLSVRARAILDCNGLQKTSIFASGNLNEVKIRDLVTAQTPIDAFGVGTDMVVSGDAPSLDLAYKLTEYDNIARIKTSAGKLTLPGKKHVFRAIDADGGFYADLIGLADETASIVAHQFGPSRPRTIELLSLQFTDGRRVMPRPTLAESRQHFLDRLEQFDPRYKELEHPGVYPTQYTRALSTMLNQQKERARRCQD